MSTATESPDELWLGTLRRIAECCVGPGPMGTPPSERTQQGFGPDGAWLESMRRWVQASHQAAHDAKVDPELWRSVFDPDRWMKQGAAPFDAALERLLDGPKNSIPWALNEKLLRLSQLTAQHARDSSDYHRLQRDAWTRAIDRFPARAEQKAGEGPCTFRELLDLWIDTVNESLLEMHRSPQFLNAQRSLTRSSTDLRLQERELVEMYCEAHHLPTRSEIDEVQRTLADLRREVRALKRSAAKNAGDVAVAPVQPPTTFAAGRERTTSRPRP